MANQKTATYNSFSECQLSNTSDGEQERDEISRYYEHHQKLFESWKLEKMNSVLWSLIILL